MELTIELDGAREVMYEELAEELDEEVLQQTMNRVVTKQITHLYDNQDAIRRANQ